MSDGFQMQGPFGQASDATSTAQTMIALVQQYVNQLQLEAENLFPPQINVNWPQLPPPPTQVQVTMPSLMDVSWSVPAQPAPFSGKLDITKYIPGQFTGVAPTLDFGTQPAQFDGQIPPSPKLDFNFDYPVLDLKLPDPPQLLSIGNVQFDPLNIPTFDTLPPVLWVSPPGIISYAEGAGYTSTLLVAAQDDLLDALTDGTNTGLPAQAQQAQNDAAYEREYRAQADALASLDRDMETLGYQLPPGVWSDARFKIYTETQNTISGLSRDIFVQTSKQQLENIVQARGQIITLEGELIGYANNMAQRAFEAAKYTTEAQIAIYNGQVQAYNAQVDGYKATVEAYNAQLKGIEIYVDQLKAQIDFENTKATINTQLVNQYKTEIDAQLAQVEIAKLQVQIIETQANVQKIQVDAYGAQIQAFVGTVNAYTAEVEGFKANAEAQGVIESVYKTQVDAYAAEVQAGVGVINALVNNFDAQIKAYESQLEGYKAALQAMVEQARAAEEYNTSLVESFKGEVSAVTSYNQVLTNQWEAVVREQQAVLEVAVKEAEANGQLYISAKQLSIDASKAAAQTASQLGAAALNAIHFSNTANWSTSQAISLSTITSTATNTNTNTNYNESA